MIQIEQVDTVEAVDPSLPTIVRSEDGKAIADADYQFAIHPDYLVNDGKNCIDRASGEQCAGPDIDVAIATAPFASGALGFDFKGMHDSGAYGQVAAIPNAISVREFSLALAIDAVYSGTPTAGASIMQSSPASPSSNWRILVTVNRLVQVFVDASSWLGDPLPLDGTPRLYLFTYSEDMGLNIYRNGVLAASRSDAIPVTGDAATGGRAMIASANHMSATSKFVMSPYYHRSADLSRPENINKRAAVTSYLMRKYIV